MTPIEKLDEAVREFVAEVGEEGVLSGFVLGYQLSTFVDEPDVQPLATTTSYTVSPSTTMESALGIHTILGIRLDRAVQDHLDAEESES